jgi:hypothetical protein
MAEVEGGLCSILIKKKLGGLLYQCGEQRRGANLFPSRAHQLNVRQQRKLRVDRDSPRGLNTQPEPHTLRFVDNGLEALLRLS